MMRGGGRADMVVALTTPPYLGLVAAAAAHWRRCRHVHWIMDIYPDVMAAHGMLRREGLVYRGLQGVTRQQLRGAALVLTLGPVMAERMKAYVPSRCRTAWIPLWGAAEPAGTQQVAQVRQARGWDGRDMILLYSGNMGLGHRFAEFLEAARRLGRSGPAWIFVGSGPRRAEVVGFATAHPEARLQLLPYVPAEELGASLCAAEIHLMSLERGWEGLLVPSKLQAAFSVGRPVLFVGPEESEVGHWITQSGGGWVVREGDVEGVLAAVEAAGDPVERARRGAAGLAFARAHFNRSANCERIADLLEEVGRRT